jgi:hypothetical protein
VHGCPQPGGNSAATLRNCRAPDARVAFPPHRPAVHVHHRRSPPRMQLDRRWALRRIRQTHQVWSARWLHQWRERAAASCVAERDMSQECALPPLRRIRSIVTRCSRAWHNWYTRRSARRRLFRHTRAVVGLAQRRRWQRPAAERMETHRSRLAAAVQLDGAGIVAAGTTCPSCSSVDDRRPASARLTARVSPRLSGPREDTTRQAAARGCNAC